MRHVGARRALPGYAVLAVAVTTVVPNTSAASNHTKPAATSTAQSARNLCAAGKRLGVAKQADAARKAYTDALRADADAAATCARSGFDLLAPKTSRNEAGGACVKADALRDAYQDDAASAEYVAVLKKDPKQACAFDALRNGRAVALTYLLEVVLDVALAVLAWAAMLLGTAAVAILVLSRWTGARKWLVRWAWMDRLLAPRIELQDLQDGAAPTGTGVGVTALAGAELLATATADVSATRYRLDRLTAREGLETALGAVEALNPSLKALAAVLGLVRWLLPRARFTASGALQVACDRGEGATVALNGGTKPVTDTLWLGPTNAVDTSGGGTAFQSLAVPVGAWIDFEVRAALAVACPVGNARSYSMLQGALDADRRGSTDTALRMYSCAIDADPDNVSAIVNLANLQARGREEYLKAIVNLEQAITILHVAP